MNRSISFAAGLLILLFAFATGVFSQSKTKAPAREMDFDEAGEEENLNRELWETVKRTPYEFALRHVRIARRDTKPKAATVTLPNGWRIAPAGEQTEVGRLPMDVVSFAGLLIVLNGGYYSKEEPEISVVDPHFMRLMKTLRTPTLFPSGAVIPGGDLFISGGVGRKIYRYDHELRLIREYLIDGFTAGITAIDTDHLAVVSLVTAASDTDFLKGSYREGRISILNITTGAVEHETNLGWFPQAVQFRAGKIYAAVSGGDNVRIFSRQLAPLGETGVGRTPQNMCADGDRLYVVNQNSDDITVIDTRNDKRAATFSVAWPAASFGSGPTSCVSAAGRLYVTQSNTNDMVVLDAISGRTLGYIPTGFYPTKAAIDGDQLIVLNGKGIRPRRPNVDGPQAPPEQGGGQYVLTLLKGSVGSIPLADISGKLSGWTDQVRSGTPFAAPGQNRRLPIKHIFYIVRENRTYDQVMGDLPRGDGDRFLTMFGRGVTPNAHRYAEEFVTLDNYYADGEISVLGHSFTTSGYASPFLEWLGNAAYSGRYSGYPFGMVPATTSPAYIWDELDDKKVDYRIYGENYYLYTRAYRILRETFGVDSDIAGKFYARMMNNAGAVDRGNQFYQFARQYYGRMDSISAAAAVLSNPEFAREFSKFLCGDDSLIRPLAENAALHIRFAEYLTRYPANYRSWDLRTSDLERAAAWKADFQKQVDGGNVAALSYLWLPNDHTGGADKRYLTPTQLVAQNDAALGVIIDTIAASPIWKDSLILVTEDDAQNGPDHVDATRTIALAIGPYVKRNAVVHDRLDQLSMLRTIEMMLGLSPLNLNDALAVPMFNIFQARPDLRRPEAGVTATALSETDRQLYQQFGQRQ
jgi:YVTN family beta-propeller protein